MAKSKQIQHTRTLDETDRAIVAELIKDSRLSYREIAVLIRKSPATVMHRLKNMEKEGVVKKYTTLIDYDKFGYDITVLISVRISKGNLFSVEKKVSTHPNVIAIYDNTGQFDATIIGRFKTRKSMDNFLKKIQKYDFIERTETKLILNTIKEEPISV